MALVRDYTVAGVARILGRTRSAVKVLIETGRLDAYNASPELPRVHYRVTQESLDVFRGLTVKPKKKAAVQRRSSGVVERVI